MQTLTAGSFLNLENASMVEALKHTARRLAEHTATVVKENLPPAALENLANNLWQKAEYVTRETERRRLHQIFIENFSERFRELKPESEDAKNSDSVASPADATVENHKSGVQSPAPVAVESGEIKSPASVENVASSALPEASTTEVEGKKDEFLGFVGPGEPFGDEREAESVTAAMTEPKETPQATAQAGDEPDAAETSQPEAQAGITETPDSANQVADAGNSKEPETAENSDQKKTEATTIAAATASAGENKPITATTTTATASANKNGAGAQEPFEFEKCTINLNLTLLPAESGKSARKAIVGAMSHNLPPEIEFLVVADGGDLTEIAGLIGEKLARFKQTLPVKYIEQLRASKNKSAKKGAVAAKTTAAAAAQHSASNQATSEKTSGGQKTQEASDVKTVTPQAGRIEEKGNNAPSTVPNQAVNQPVAANNIQGSLF